jgi:hypothetical protein
MRVLERKEVFLVAGSDGGGGYGGVPFDAGVSAPASPSYATNPTCPGGYSPMITGSQTNNGIGWSTSFGIAGPVPTVSVTFSSVGNSTTTTSNCVPTVSGTGAPETTGNPYGDPYGATGSNGP